MDRSRDSLMDGSRGSLIRRAWSAQVASVRGMGGLCRSSAYQPLGGDGLSHRFAVSAVAYLSRDCLWAGLGFPSLSL